jgi:hypothetical protein
MLGLSLVSLPDIHTDMPSRSLSDELESLRGHLESIERCWPLTFHSNMSSSTRHGPSMAWEFSLSRCGRMIFNSLPLTVPVAEIELQVFTCTSTWISRPAAGRLPDVGCRRMFNSTQCDRLLMYFSTRASIRFSSFASMLLSLVEEAIYFLWHNFRHLHQKT